MSKSSDLFRKFDRGAIVFVQLSMYHVYFECIIRTEISSIRSTGQANTQFTVITTKWALTVASIKIRPP